MSIEGVELYGLLDTGSQVTLMQQSLFEQNFTQAKQEGGPAVFKLRAANGLEIPYISYAVFDVEVEGLKIPGRGVVSVNDVHCPHSLIVGMNVVTACWNTLFKWPENCAYYPLSFRSQPVWRDAFATCQRVEAATAGDGLMGFEWPASRRSIKVPPRSEMLVWGRTRTGRSKDYCALVAALCATTYVGVAKTLAVVKRSRIRFRICSPHAYAVTVGQSQKLAKLYCIEEAHVHGPQDLNLIMKDDSTVEIVMMDVTTEENQKLPKEVSNLANCANLTERQQEDLRALLRKWSRVFAQHDEDFGRTDLVQHPIRTGDAPPIKEWY